MNLKTTISEGTIFDEGTLTVTCGNCHRRSTSEHLPKSFSGIAEIIGGVRYSLLCPACGFTLKKIE